MSPTSPRPLLAHTPDELSARFTELGAKPFHARIAREALFSGARSYEEMTSLPADLRTQLAAEIPLLSSVLRHTSRASDGATKLLLSFPGRIAPKGADANDTSDAEDGRHIDGASDAGDGHHVDRAGDPDAGREIHGAPIATDEVETVHIPPHNPNSPKGATLCVSTQVGCPVACPFCASGLAGLVRNLEAHEIIEQFLHGLDIGPIGRAVVMGIGEPLLNYTNVRAALDTVHQDLKMGARKITLSTVGFPDRLRQIAPTKPPFQLAISLHTPFDEERDTLVPAMRGVPIEDILQAGDDWFHQTHREVTYEYVLLGGHNDTPDHAAALAERLHRRRANVNLIPWNPLTQLPGDTPPLPYRRPTPETVQGFQQDLQDNNIITTVRWSRGLDTDAACGQLRLHPG